MIVNVVPDAPLKSDGLTELITGWSGISAHVGMVPFDVSTKPFVPIVNLVRVLVADAYNISPAAYVDCEVPPDVAPSVPVTPVDKGRLEALVKLIDGGVPNPIALPEASRYT